MYILQKGLLFSIALLCLSTTGLYADAAGYSSVSTGMCFPVLDKDIQMVNENIIVIAAINYNIDGKTPGYRPLTTRFPFIQTHYSCSFLFKNTSKMQKKVNFGFPFQLGLEYSPDGKIINYSDIFNIKFFINNKPVDFELALQSASKEFPRAEYPYDFVILNTQELKPDEEMTMKVEYDTIVCDNYYGAYSLKYIVKSAKTWMHPIGTAVFQFNFYGFLKNFIDPKDNEGFKIIQNPDNTACELEYKNWIPEKDLRINISSFSNLSDSDFNNHRGEKTPLTLFSADEVAQKNKELKDTLLKLAVSTILENGFKPELAIVWSVLSSVKDGITAETKKMVEANLKVKGYLSLDDFATRAQSQMIEEIFKNPQYAHELGYMKADEKSVFQHYLDLAEKIALNKFEDEKYFLEYDKYLLAGDQSHYLVVHRDAHIAQFIADHRDTFIKAYYACANDYLYKDSNIALSCYLCTLMLSNPELTNKIHGYQFYIPWPSWNKAFMLDDMKKLKEIVTESLYLLKAKPASELVPVYYIAYNFACAFSMLKDAYNALFWLKTSIELGLPDKSLPLKDPDLAYVRDSAPYAFKQVIESYVP